MTDTAVRDPAIRQWEVAEISRSRIEAERTLDDTLLLTAATIARYASPPASTAYPLEYAYHVLGDVRGRRVLDFGCGSGTNSVLLAQRGARVYGVDISEPLVRKGRRRLAEHGAGSRATLLVGSGHSLPFRAGSLDVVFGIAILHHLDLDLVSNEVHRVLKPRGRAIFQEPVRNSAAVRFLRRLVPYRAPDVSPYERPLTDEELSAFARRFRNVRSRAFALPYVQVGQLVPALRGPTARLYELDARLLERFPRLRYYAGIRVLELTK